MGKRYQGTMEWAHTEKKTSTWKRQVGERKEEAGSHLRNDLR